MPQRAGGVRERTLVEAGIDVRHGAASGLVVAGRGATGDAHLIVRARKRDRGEDLYRLVDKLTLAVGRAVGPSAPAGQP